MDVAWKSLKVIQPHLIIIFSSLLHFKIVYQRPCKDPWHPCQVRLSYFEFLSTIPLTVIQNKSLSSIPLEKKYFVFIACILARQLHWSLVGPGGCISSVCMLRNIHIHTSGCTKPSVSLFRSGLTWTRNPLLKMLLLIRDLGSAVG